MRNVLCWMMAGGRTTSRGRAPHKPLMLLFEDHKISTVESRLHRIARDPYHKAAGLCEPYAGTLIQAVITVIYTAVV
jgi:hypothetical protein